MTTTRHWVAAFAMAAAAAVVLAGCGSSDSGTQGGTAGASGSAEPATVTLGVIPIIDVAPVYLGQQQGFFKNEGINLQISDGQGGAAIVPGVVSGSINIGFGNNFSVETAASKNLPLEVIAAGVSSTADPKTDPYAIMTHDPSIKRPKDLEGKKVATNTVNAIGDTVVKASVEADGGDPRTINFVELAFPNMNAALLSGEIDAAWQSEPFIAIGESQGLRILTTPLNDFTDIQFQVSTYFTSSQYAKDHADVVERFTKAINKSMEYAQAHPDAVREILPTYIKMDKSLADQVRLPAWPTEISRPTFDLIKQMGIKYGLFQDVNLDNLLKDVGK